jgi:hypothetical protein
MKGKLDMSKKQVIWLLTAPLDYPGVSLVASSVAWLAEEAGAAFECYFECARDGQLFARTGSTVLGGHHHHQFNWLCAKAEMKIIRLGDARLFESSAKVFGLEYLAEAENPLELYQKLLAHLPDTKVQELLFAPEFVDCGKQHIEIGPYVFPEIFYRKALAFTPSDIAKIAGIWGKASASALYLSEGETKELKTGFPSFASVDSIRPDDGFGTLTMRIAKRWKKAAKGVVFGDPPAVVSQIASHCRNRRIAVYAPSRPVPSDKVMFSYYTEEHSTIADETAALAEEIGNKVIVGRQTCDGDIIHWSKSGVCIQIIDPNRPAFPIVETLPQKWTKPEKAYYELEPSDAELREWAKTGRCLSTLVWHSGEVAHNEAMLNLIDLAVINNVKMGIGVHAQRYETCPQMWELIQTPADRGGALGLIEPILHSGGLGVMAEIHAPAEVLLANCREALKRIKSIAGQAGVPKGYYAFLDADLCTLSKTRPEIWESIADAGLEYIVSSAFPGLNRVLWEKNKCLALNQTCRVVQPASPFVRLSGSDDCKSATPRSPGWIIAVQDAPVVAFNPYIWEEGSNFMKLVRWLKDGGKINVTPNVIARYAKILRELGYIPCPEGKN